VGVRTQPFRDCRVITDVNFTGPVTGPQDTRQAAGDIVAGLFREHGLSLVRLAVLLTGDRATAEDVVQDAFLRFQRARPRLRDQDKALAYLRASVVNGCRSVLRSRRRLQFGPDEVDLPVSSAEAAVMAEQDRRLVLAAVRRLPVRMREVLALRYYLDLPYEEIAAVLGVSKGTVSSTMSRALAALGRDLKEEL
jgi:RNA polymerase sigma-70 factor (sigma-E family)